MWGTHFAPWPDAAAAVGPDGSLLPIWSNSACIVRTVSDGNETSALMPSSTPIITGCTMKHQLEMYEIT